VTQAKPEVMLGQQHDIHVFGRAALFAQCVICTEKAVANEVATFGTERDGFVS